MTVLAAHGTMAAEFAVLIAPIPLAVVARPDESLSVAKFPPTTIWVASGAMTRAATGASAWGTHVDPNTPSVWAVLPVTSKRTRFLAAELPLPFWLTSLNDPPAYTALLVATRAR